MTRYRELVRAVAWCVAERQRPELLAPELDAIEKKERRLRKRMQAMADHRASQAAWVGSTRTRIAKASA